MKTSLLLKVISGIDSAVVCAGVIFYLLNENDYIIEASGAEDSTARKYDAGGYDTESFDKNRFDRESFDGRNIISVG